MKKILSFFLSIMLISIASFAPSAASESWYFVSKGQNERPRLPALREDLGKGIGKDEKVVYLTFDAGYENGNVEKCVAALESEGVVGTFFVLRHFVEENTPLCIRMGDDGFLLASHTASHPNIAKISGEKLQEELATLEEVYTQATGRELARYLRPPEGAYNTAALEKAASLGYRTVFWSLAWEDWDNKNQKSPEYAMEKLLSRVHNGAVILLHPTSSTNAKILSPLIRELKARGYEFKTVEALWEE